MEDRSRRMVTRSKKLKVQKDSPAAISKPLIIRANKMAKSARPEKKEVKNGASLNTNGFPMLPDELLLEIMSFYPPKSDLLSMEPNDYRALAQDASEYAVKRDTLIALAQTCRNLRRFCRPYIWSRIEVCHGIRVGEAVLGVWTKGSTTASIDRMFNAELVRQLEIVTVRDPSLAKYIKLLNVDLRDYSTPTVLAELARCIALFPNLRLVKLNVSSSKRKTDKLDTAVGKAFSSYLYPQVDQAFVSKSAIAFLRCCPSLRLANLMDYGIRRSSDYGLAMRLKGSCPRLENLMMGIGEVDCKETLQAFPNLREVTLVLHAFHHGLFMNKIAMFSTLKHLKYIKLTAITSLQEADRRTILDMAIQILLKLQKEDKEEKEASLTYTAQDSPRYLAYWNQKTETICLPVPKPR
ncbi:hypothetical protein GALMADRAFT_153580 [Galerina marginata CBS 339.88]|uniref:Uncharacterized protein n=1 Tax=Galerina marginata (strain CBS 339.88) TaxID=685588 RepID=A0A067T9K9_GALM3|nr:hypothetical protein GALMADRAFT_153580 [Galerina marginata CBS 339.88]